ncbi:MAG: V-type ATPase subunit, partial [Gammaproteobacteria bacterium]|nr:V-type ATPase subunit [Gammaproteobacteria bacterium]
MGVARYAYLNTRVTMLAARLIPLEILQSLVDQPPSEFSGANLPINLEEIMDDSSVDSTIMEQGLLTSLLCDFKILTRPVSGSERTFLGYLIHWFELANLKALIRGKFAGLPDEVIRAQLVNIDPFTTLPIDELLHTEDPAEMLRHLESTPYSDIARQARKVYEEKQDLFVLDATLDRRFFQGLLKHAMNVTKGERSGVLDVAGCLLDRFNLQWLLRYRFSYKLSPAETFYLLIPAGHHLNLDYLLSLSQLTSLDEVLDNLPETIKPALEGSATITEVENRLEKRTREIAERYIKDTRYVIARAFAYLLLREMEMRMLLAVIEGRRLRFSPELIRFAAGIG